MHSHSFIFSFDDFGLDGIGCARLASTRAAEGINVDAAQRSLRRRRPHLPAISYHRGAEACR